MDEQKKLQSYDEILAAQVDQTPKFVPTPGIAEAMKKALDAIKGRSFSGRHPELGKMIKCQVCTRRHRAAQTCAGKFKYLHTEEDLETGEKTDVLAEHKFGKSMVKGVRRRQRPNHNHLEVVEIAKDIYGRDEAYDRTNPEHLATLEEVRIEAVREWKRRRRVAAKKKRKQQDVSRRINRGLLQGGFRP